MDFGDLKDDKNIQEKLINFHNSIDKIDRLLKIINNNNSNDFYQQLNIKDKIAYDLLMAYTLNTLYWLYLRTKGEDPNSNDVKNQLNRIKEYMLKAKQAIERHTIRPKIDQAASERFIKHGLNYKNKRNEENKASPNYNQHDHQPNKKRKINM